MFAEEVTKRTKGSLKFEIYPGSSLMKTVAQFSALRKGALDMSLYPLAYAGGEVLVGETESNEALSLAWADRPVTAHAPVMTTSRTDSPGGRSSAIALDAPVNLADWLAQKEKFKLNTLFN